MRLQGRVGIKKLTQKTHPKNPKKPTLKNPQKIFGFFWFFFKFFSKVCTQLRIFQKEIKSTLNQELIHILGERG
jgi:hypothetical protein